MLLKKKIKSKGLTYGWVADQLGVNRSTFVVYLNDESKMSEELRMKIKQFLKKYQ